VRLPKGPHTPEFWAAYQGCLGGEILSPKTFDDLINAYKVSSEFLKRAEATKRDYLRYLDIISEAWGSCWSLTAGGSTLSTCAISG
jgi:hypothetical protein